MPMILSVCWPGGAWLGSPIDGLTASSTGSSTLATPRAKS